MSTYTYYLWMKQSGYGCEYTIGCAEKLVALDTNSLETAKQKVPEVLQDYGADIEKSMLLRYASDTDDIIHEMEREADEEARRQEAVAKQNRIEELRAELAKLEQP